MAEAAEAASSPAFQGPQRRVPVVAMAEPIYSTDNIDLTGIPVVPIIGHDWAQVPPPVLSLGAGSLTYRSLAFSVRHAIKSLSHVYVPWYL